MKIFVNRWFEMFLKKEKLSLKKLFEITSNIEKGLIDVNYGGNVIKQRVSRKGSGKSSGYRTIIIYKKRETAFFVYGFAKSDQENISKEEVEEFKKLADITLKMTNKELKDALESKVYIEVFKND